MSFLKLNAMCRWLHRFIAHSRYCPIIRLNEPGIISGQNCMGLSGNFQTPQYVQFWYSITQALIFLQTFVYSCMIERVKVSHDTSTKTSRNFTDLHLALNMGVFWPFMCCQGSLLSLRLFTLSVVWIFLKKAKNKGILPRDKELWETHV